MHLRGEIGVWREGAGWQVATSALRVDGVGYGADLRGGMLFQGDGTRPYIDIAADLDDAVAIGTPHLAEAVSLRVLDRG